MAKLYIFNLISFSILFLMVENQVPAQIWQTKPDSTESEEEEEVDVFDESYYFGAGNDVLNAVKLNFFSVFYGEIPVFFERKLIEKLSAEVGLGLTFRNFGSDLWRELIYEDNVEAWNNVDREYGFGLSFSAGLRFFPAGYTMEEWYFAPEFRTRNYRSKGTVCDNDMEPTGPALNENFRQTDLRLVAGYMNYLDDHVFTELFFGAGIRFENRDWVVCRYNYETLPQPVVESRLELVKKSYPVFVIGLKIGFGFP